MTDEDTVEIAQLLHHKWSEAAHIKVQTEAEGYDDKTWEGDGLLFHNERLKNAVINEAKYRGLKTRFINEHRAVINKAYGL